MQRNIDRRPSPDGRDDAAQSSPVLSHVVPAPRRYPSLDAVRGFALAVGFFAEATELSFRLLPQSTIRDLFITQLTHTKWDGISLLDIGWPAYLCISGISLSLSIEKRLGQNQSRASIFFDLVRKSLLVFVFSFFFQGGFSVPLSEINFAAVFFIYALCIVLAAAAKLWIPASGIFSLIVFLVVGFSVATIAGTWQCFGTIQQTPTANLDMAVKEALGSHYLYKYLWFFPRMFIIFLCGLLFARLYQSDISPQRRAATIAAIGIGLVNIGYVMDVWIPINKVLWTTSFAVCALGFTCFFLFAFCQVIEVWGFHRFEMPWVVFGVNPLASWTAFALVPFRGYANRAVGYLFEPVLGEYNEVLLGGVQVGLCWLLFYVLYRNKIQIRF